MVGVRTKSGPIRDHYLWGEVGGKMWGGKGSGGGLSWQVGWHETTQIPKASGRLLVWEHLSDLVGGTNTSSGPGWASEEVRTAWTNDLST